MYSSNNAWHISNNQSSYERAEALLAARRERIGQSDLTVCLRQQEGADPFVLCYCYECIGDSEAPTASYRRDSRRSRW